MSAPNFASILDDSPTEVSRPKPLPAGTFVTRVIGAPRYDKSSKKQTPFVEFQLKLIAAEEDVDEDDLAEALGDKSIQERVIPYQLYLTEDAVYRLDEFHEHCGIDLEDEQSRRQRNEEVVNSEVRVVIAHEASQDGQQVFARVRRTLPAES
jgi:hypothetical protein